jgi:hypothetical protein
MTVEFDTDSALPPRYSPAIAAISPDKLSVPSEWLIQRGIIKSEKTLEILLAVFSIIFLIISALLIYKTFFDTPTLTSQQIEQLRQQLESAQSNPPIL